MTKEQIASLKLGITVDTKTELMLNAALEWIAEYTTIDTTDIENLPAGAKLFMTKFCEINGIQGGVASESIEGLSLSFNTGDKASLLMDIAETLMGKYLKGQVRFVQATKRWR